MRITEEFSGMASKQPQECWDYLWDPSGMIVNVMYSMALSFKDQSWQLPSRWVFQDVPPSTLQHWGPNETSNTFARTPAQPAAQHWGSATVILGNDPCRPSGSEEPPCGGPVNLGKWWELPRNSQESIRAGPGNLRKRWELPRNSQETIEAGPGYLRSLLAAVQEIAI